MKHLLSLFFVCLCSASALGQNTLNIHQKDGGVVSYSFSEKPVVTYTTDGIHLSTTQVEVDYPMSNLLKFTFEDSAEETGLVLTEAPDADVRIYTLGGVLVRTVKASDGRSAFSTTDLPAGTYIIKNGKTTYKIQKR